jgi:CheY-like chemotaxis protein/signal transduction histidine kinase
MLETVRARVSRWIAGPKPAPTGDALLLGGHEEIRDIARQLARTKTGIDRSLLAFRGWAREIGRRLEDHPTAVGRGVDLRALGETVGGLTHNFNNSLAAILAYTELLLREVQGETAQRRLRVIRDVALEASDSLRRFQEMVSREPQVAFGPVALAAVVREALELTAPRWRDEAERHGIAIAVTQELDAIPPIEGNAFELRDVLIQLILNAVDAMPAGGTLDIRARPDESGWVVLDVSHGGAEMSAPVRRQLTGPPAFPGPSGRLGGGLGDVADIVARHGGTVSVEGPATGGTRVTLRLHASRFQIIPPSEDAVVPPEPGEAAHVLLVDDDQRLLTVLSDMLRAGGHAVTTATSGEEALRVFDPAGHDVVITDLGMPRMNGWEVAERVKGRSPRTPVFLLTGWGERVTAGEGSRFVDQVIAKPVSADALLGRLSRLGRVGVAGA